MEVALGVFANNTKVNTGFDIYNEKQAPLEISAIRTTCGCAVSDMKLPITISAGGKETIRLRVNTKEVGSHSYTVTLTAQEFPDVDYKEIPVRITLLSV